MTATPGTPPQAEPSQEPEPHENSGWRTFGLVVLALFVGPLVTWGAGAGVVRAYHFFHALHHPTAFATIGYGGGGTVRVGTTFTFPISPAPWETDHGTLHVHSVAPLPVGQLPAGATFTVWRCSRTDVGPGGWAMGVGPITSHCTDPEKVIGPFDYDAGRGSREALLLAVSSPTPGTVRFAGVVIDYREGLDSGAEKMSIFGRVTFRP